jgi:hypothetical protein
MRLIGPLFALADLRNWLASLLRECCGTKLYAKHANARMLNASYGLRFYGLRLLVLQTMAELAS